MKYLTVIVTLLLQIIAVSNAEHTNNWAVLVSTSRFWFNYRHMANVLSMYRTVKRLGIPDSQIILMLSDDVACNSRNLFPGSVFNNKDHAIDLYGDNVEVDYRGYEVTVENFIRLLTDRWSEDQPKSKRLLTDENSNILVYMTGHGGDDFLKFQDAEEIASEDIADAFAQMYEKKRYNEIFFMIDTCQANTMYSKFYSPNILAVGSSRFEESSYSHHSDVEIGVAVIDRFTYYTLEFMETIEKDSDLTLQDLFDSYTFEKVHSHVGVRTDLIERDPKDILITDFFGNVQNLIPDNNAKFSDAKMKDSDNIINLSIQKESEIAQVEKSHRIINNTFTKALGNNNFKVASGESNSYSSLIGLGAFALIALSILLSK
ncbi:similar to Saccharomyces cerevisiae YDR331W GPI8 ER membrane glycoprotein subunit of the glycosylphosphatidylinositol transamidase complex [Maudiozyma barnettii]|uniref:Similar to Saccharomyces cerevisiae YDR331W GPI8 ER membrane glycoprotein subunit of the glycosylphosphatidylinositol transamidase complex n=1 Tax=Maudiozyma barnettii TaxID=61262 RepID=A0A8H2VDZ9_9SACH|nr:GPI-anchor transamidase [Kazachstania barnettii]CAB4253791.1 similar to Saccharomyces cerevisiae YDR331W GPI8 ER membrane glycoprotein subunit of the glycosylphosphatidylinositol transamidase complex [Kazachstania barnettii]CAD1781540.1 similar to Saccharomyces cerevisiae YDR331W GPI8 ER membrane glycoprotein subunit of the glycosylphosphatidylinositol transamidase complex [Kazachstania barnettii]